MPDFDYRVVFDSVAWEEPMPGLRFKARRGHGKQLRLVEYGREMEPHWCEKGHLGYILDGRFEIAFDSGVVVYEPGDGIFIPSGRAHRHMGKSLTEVVRAVMIEDLAE